MSDYREDPSRDVLFSFGRYKLTKSKNLQSYSVWYGGNILKVGSLQECRERFNDGVNAALEWRTE